MSGQLQKIYDDLGRPSAQKLLFAARRKGIQINELEAKEFISRQSTGQVFQGRIQSDGKIPGGGREDMRWQMDLIDFSKRIKKINSGHRYVLVAIDNFDRTLFTVAMQAKTADATLAAFKRIISQNGGVMPKEITVDLGNEYALLEPYITERGGVLRRKNVQSVNTLALVDKAIGTLKQILSSYSLTKWADSLKKATEVYNERSHARISTKRGFETADKYNITYVSTYVM